MKIRAREVRALRATRTHAAALLSRYPQVSDEETKEILSFLRYGRHLDIGMVTGDESLRRQLDRFMVDHGKHLRVGFLEGTAVVAAIGAFLVACWLVWESIKPVALAA